MEPRHVAHPPPRKPPIGPAAFFAVDLRVGRITEVSPFPEARRPAWKLSVDFGSAVGTLRTSAQVISYAPEQLLGRLVAGAINLGDKRIAGFTSQFLILGSLDADGTVRLLAPDEGAQPGDEIA